MCRVLEVIGKWLKQKGHLECLIVSQVISDMKRTKQLLNMNCKQKLSAKQKMEQVLTQAIFDENEMKIFEQ